MLQVDIGHVFLRRIDLPFDGPVVPRDQSGELFQRLRNGFSAVGDRRLMNGVQVGHVGAVLGDILDMAGDLQRLSSGDFNDFVTERRRKNNKWVW